MRHHGEGEEDRVGGRRPRSDEEPSPPGTRDRARRDDRVHGARGRRERQTNRDSDRGDEEEFEDHGTPNARFRLKAAGKPYRDRLFRTAVRIGGSTYSREPFAKQVAELRESGFEYAELDLTWLTLEPAALQDQAEDLAEKLPLETAHLPPSAFHQADLAKFVGFIDALAPIGTRIFNAHFMEARSAPRTSPEAKTSWLADLVKAATDRGVIVAVENVDEPPDVLRKVLDMVPDLRYWLDVGHAHLDARTDGARTYLAALADRLGLAHLHDNHGGHGEAGDEHLPFGHGTIDLVRDVTALKARGYGGPGTPAISKGAAGSRRAGARPAPPGG